MSDPTLTFATQAEWESWLDLNGGTATGAWLRLAKKPAEQPTVSYSEAVETALCFGWVDGQKQAESESFWLQRFTPRAAKSTWSKINTKKAEALISSGRMRPSGLREIDRAKQDGRWDAAYSSASKSAVPDDFQQALDANREAKAFFATLDSQNRFSICSESRAQKKRKHAPEKLHSSRNVGQKREAALLASVPKHKAPNPLRRSVQFSC